MAKLKKECSAKYKGLSIQQEKFVDYYMDCGDRIASVKLAGYVTKYPHVRATYLLNKCKPVMKLLQRMLDEEMIYHDVKESELIMKLKSIAYNDEEHTNNQVKALETLMKYKGMLTDKIHHTGSLDQPVTVNVILESDGETK